MQLFHFWKATGLHAICWTYSDFMLYKQTPSTFTFSLLPLDVTLDATTDNTQNTARSVRAAFFLLHWATELQVLWQWLCFRSQGPWSMPWHTEQVLGAPICAPGAPKHAWDAVRSVDPEVSFSASEALEGMPAPATAWKDGPARRKKHHEAGETNADLHYGARGEVLVGTANDAKKTYFGTKQRSKLSICKFSRSGLDSDSKAVYPQELSPRWRCWVNWRWPPTDPEAASASGAQWWQPGSSSPKQHPFKTPLQKQQLRWPRSQPPGPVQHGGHLPSPSWGFIHLHLLFLAAISSDFSNLGHW